LGAIAGEKCVIANAADACFYTQQLKVIVQGNLTKRTTFLSM